MNFGELSKNALAAFISQAVSLTLSVAMSLFIPKILVPEAFGYWQLFLFYSSYVGFMHFGLNDGVYLLTGGTRREDLDKPEIASQLVFGLSLQIPISVGIVIFAFSENVTPDRRFVLISTAGYLVIYNVWGYLGLLFQAINETRLYSYSILANRLAFLLSTVLLIAFRYADYRVFVTSYIGAQLLSLVYCIWNARNILATRLLPTPATIQVSLHSISVGARLMFANIASMLIIGAARFLIDLEWSIEEFARISFALSLIGFFLTFIGQVGMVLFPALREASKSELESLFRSLRDLLSSMLPMIYVAALPAQWLISIWLPQYSDSLHYFTILLPLCVFDGKMSLLYATYFKVVRKEQVLLTVNVGTLAISSLGALLGTFIFRSIEVVLLSAVLAIILRCVASDMILSREFPIKRQVSALGDILLTVVFLLSNLLAPGAVTFWIFMPTYCAFLLFYRKVMLHIILGIAKTRRSTNGPVD